MLVVVLGVGDVQITAVLLNGTPNAYSTRWLKITLVSMSAWAPLWDVFMKGTDLKSELWSLLCVAAFA